MFGEKRRVCKCENTNKEYEGNVDCNGVFICIVCIVKELREQGIDVVICEGQVEV